MNENEEPKSLVKQGYNQLGSTYRLHYEQGVVNRYYDWLQAFTLLLPQNGAILELGCGDGIPTAQFLAKAFRYMGVDMSPVQIAQAQHTVSEAHFVVADMSALRLRPSSFDGVIALYSIIHLPLAEQPKLFQRIHKWLKPGGYFLGILGAKAWTGTESNWITEGVSMYWSHADADTYQYWFQEIGFTVVERQFVAEGEGGHTRFLLKK